MAWTSAASTSASLGYHPWMEMPPWKLNRSGALCFQESKSNCTCGGAHSDSDPAIPCDSMRFHDQTVFWLPLVSGETAEEKSFDSRQPALPPTFSCQVESFSECCVMLCLRSLTRWLACNQHRPMPQIHQMQTCCAHQSESCISPTLRSSHLPCCDLPSGAWGYGSTYTGKRESHAKVMSKVFSTWHRNHYISTWHLFNWCTFKMLLRAASRFCFLLVLWNYRQYVHMFSSVLKSR